MPNLDGTGPANKGPMTGKRLGNCQVRGGHYRGMARCKGCGLEIKRFWADSKLEIADLKVIESQLIEDLNDVKREIAEAENQE